MGSVVPQSGLFSLLPERKPPWIEFTLSTNQWIQVISQEENVPNLGTRAQFLLYGEIYF